MDAPTHTEAGDRTIDEVPLAQCMGPAWLVKLDGIAPRTLITVADLGAVAARFAPGESLILRTGWSAYVDEAKWRDELPRISTELARWCVEHRVKLLGVEPPSVADVNDLPELIRIHQTLLSGGVLIVEGLTNIEAILQESLLRRVAAKTITRGRFTRTGVCHRRRTMVEVLNELQVPLQAPIAFLGDPFPSQYSIRQIARGVDLRHQ